MMGQKLDAELAEYYKLLAILHAISGNFPKAQEIIKEYVRVALPELGAAADSKQSETEKILETMDKWVLRIVPESIPKENSGFILRKKPVDFTPNRRRRRKY